MLCFFRREGLRLIHSVDHDGMELSVIVSEFGREREWISRSGCGSKLESQFPIHHGDRKEIPRAASILALKSGQKQKTSGLTSGESQTHGGVLLKIMRWNFQMTVTFETGHFDDLKQS